MKKPNYWIQTYSGSAFDFENPETHLFRKLDFAHSLAMIPRFNGHTRFPYSVAEHSIRASYLVPEEKAFEALMHDVSEAYVCDIPTPLKKLLPDYQKIQKRVEIAIAIQFGLPLEMSPEVKLVDTRLLISEKEKYLIESVFPWSSYGDIKPYTIEEYAASWPKNLPSLTANPNYVEFMKKEFIKRFDELWGNHKIPENYPDLPPAPLIGRPSPTIWSNPVAPEGLITPNGVSATKEIFL